MSQRIRVLKALRRYPEGVCQAEFLLPNVLDGGSPITRLAARIKDLKDEGHDIVVAGERFACAVYVLARPEAQPIPPLKPLEPPMDENAPFDVLFDMPVKPASPYDEEAA